MKVKSYKELLIWKKGIEIADLTYKTTENFPPKELYILSSQMQRAAISIPSNIAEGFSRGHTAEYKQFLRIALGSCSELETQLTISQKRNYINETEMQCLSEQLEQESRMIMSLVKNLGKNVKP